MPDFHMQRILSIQVPLHYFSSQQYLISYVKDVAKQRRHMWRSHGLTLDDDDAKNNIQGKEEVRKVKIFNLHFAQLYNRSRVSLVLVCS